MKDQFYNVEYEEQETIININYAQKQVSVYTNRRSVYDRIVKRIGEPRKKYYTSNKISGANWDMSFDNRKKITSILSRPILIGNMK